MSYGYDANGGRTSMADGTGTTTYSLDELGRPTAVSTPTAYGVRVIGYRYDLDGNRAKIIYSDNTAVTYTFDKAGRLASLADWGNRQTSYTYAPDGRVSGTTSVNSSVFSYSYDNARRVTQISEMQGATTLVQNRYTLDAVGNRTVVEDLVAQATGSPILGWGPNDYGQLGDGTTLTRTSPTPVGGLGSVNRLATGQSHSVAILTDGTLRSWGRNQHGQLGDGTTTDRLTPVAIPNFPAAGKHVIGISAGANHALAVTDDDIVWAWGDNTSGQLGNGALGDRSSPSQVTGNIWQGSITWASAGFNHSLALGYNEVVYAWGDNTYGELGDGTTTSRNTASTVKGVGGVGNLLAYQISAGHFHNLAVADDGKVYAWGRNDTGQLGDGTLLSSTTPLVVRGPDGVTPFAGISSAFAFNADDIGGGAAYSVAMKSDGTLWAWGDNTDGQLGDGTTVRRPFPVRVGGPSFGSVAKVAAGGGHVVAVKTDGTVWTWGRNDRGQLGRASSETCETNVPCSTTPQQVLGLPAIAGVFTKFDHTIVTSSGGGITRYSYDRLYRVTSDGTTTFTYDPVGNRSSTTVAGASTKYAYDRADRITGVGSIPYTVDAAGNMTQRGSDTLGYDQENRLKNYQIPFPNPGYGVLDHVYNGDGLLVSEAGGNRTFVYDVSRPLPVVAQDAPGTVKYVWGLSLAYRADTSGNIQVMHADALASIRSLTDANGNVLGTYQRETFGARTSTTGSSPQPFDFTGELREPDPTGLLYLRARMYDPQIGRFISRDSFGGSPRQPTTMNRFSYVYNNPATLRDPSGRCPFCILGAIALGVKLGLFTFDVIDTVQTVLDPAASDVDKGLGVAAFAAGLAVPGGGTGVKTAARFVVDARGAIRPFLRNGLEVSEHAARRMAQREISLDVVDGIVTNQAGFRYWYEGMWRIGYYDTSRRVFVGTADGVVTTVIDKVDPRYIRNLLEARP